jgi:Secretion system C-terminal sorting domain
LVSVYPNPASDRLFVKGLASNATVQVIDMLGNIISSNEYNNINADVEVNISALAKGSYIIKIAQEGKFAAKSFIKAD